MTQALYPFAVPRSLPEPLRLVVLGATGSIGMQTLDLVTRFPDRLELAAVAVQSRWSELAAALATLPAASARPLVTVGDVAARDAAARSGVFGDRLLPDADATAAAGLEADVVVNGIVGVLDAFAVVGVEIFVDLALRVVRLVQRDAHDAVRRGHTIGLCFGPAGVGKTLSARRYARWDKAHDLLTYWGPRSDNDAKIYAALNRSRTVLYTPSVLTTPRTLKDELTQAITRTNMCIEQHLVPPGTATPEAWGWRHGRNYVELIIVDEAERLRPAALELLRDRYDRDDIALILIGMPGLEKQFSHYPQFYSRVGFAHQYRPLGQDELLFVLERHWRSLGKTLDPDDFTDAQAIAAIARITRGNFRLLERLFPQIQRVLKINELDTITNDVIEAAQSTLVIGVT